MQVSISARHGNLSDATKEKIAAKADKLVRIFDRLTSIEVTVDLEHEATPSIDVRVSAEHKHDFVATDRSDNFWGSVDNAIHKVEQQLRKYKEKIQGRHRQPGGRRIDMTEGALSEADDEFADEGTEIDE